MIYLLAADAFRRAVTRFVGRLRSIDLVQNDIVDVSPKGVVDGVDVDLRSIGR